MQKKKLDLNNLLAKYESISSNTYNSPLRQHNQQPIEEQFYQHPGFSRTAQEPQAPFPEKSFNTTHQPARSSQGNFSLTKSEIQSFLLSIREDIRTEERGLAKYSQITLKNLTENFSRNLQKAKRELLQVFNQAFHELEKTIKQQLVKQSKNQSPELGGVLRRISALDQDIDRLINSLKGAQYRKTIAQVVTRDFNLEMGQLKNIIETAKTTVTKNQTEIQFDRTKVEVIKSNLQRLFILNRRNIQLVDVSARNEGSGFNAFKQKVETPVSQSRARRSFFNFGND